MFQFECGESTHSQSDEQRKCVTPGAFAEGYILFQEWDSSPGPTKLEMDSPKHWAIEVIKIYQI